MVDISRSPDPFNSAEKASSGGTSSDSKSLIRLGIDPPADRDKLLDTVFLSNLRAAGNTGPAQDLHPGSANQNDP